MIRFQTITADVLDDIISVSTHDEVWEGIRVADISKEEFAERLKANVPDGYVMLIEHEGEVAGNIMFLRTYQNEQPSACYEQHTALRECLRADGEHYFEDALRFMFVQTDAMFVRTECPDWNPLLVRVAGKVGAKKMFCQPRKYAKDGKQYGVTHVGISMMDWAHRHHLEYAQVGDEWHDQLFAGGEPHHDDDEAHNGFLGLALRIGQHNPRKAADTYNAWAFVSNYWPATVEWIHQDSDGGIHSIINIGVSKVLNGPEGVQQIIPI
jgi:hypothetical protein